MSFLIDYKSNHLGNDASAYTQQAMNEAVAHHHYYLQAPDLRCCHRALLCPARQAVAQNRHPLPIPARHGRLGSRHLEMGHRYRPAFHFC